MIRERLLLPLSIVAAAVEVAEVTVPTYFRQIRSIHLQHLLETEKRDSPSATPLTTSTRCSNGTKRKLTACTHGHTKKLFFMPGTHAFLSFSFGLPPSRYAMLDKKSVMFNGAKTNWSQAMRAAMERFVVERWTRSARNLYQWVAAGPKMRPP